MLVSLLRISLYHLTQPDRTKRVKDARTEGKVEIDEHRDQKEGEFKAFEKEVRQQADRSANSTVADQMVL